MDNELRNHKKSDTTKWWLTLIAFMLMGATLLGLVTGFIVPKEPANEDIPKTEQSTEIPNEPLEPIEPIEPTNGIGTEVVNSPYVRLMATPMTVAANATYAEQTLTATVLPATATNKAVDWSVAWADGQTGNISDYVTVTPASNGSTTASVKCYQPFTGNAVVTVTTRESGYTAECIITFVGLPTEINVSGPFSESADGYYYVGVGDTYSYSVDLNNLFGTVGADYQDVTVTLGGYGSVVLGNYDYYSQSGTSTWYDSTIHNVTLESLKDKFLSVDYSNGVLNITTVKTIESYYESMKRIDGGRTRSYTNKFKEYATDDAYFYIRIDQPDTGISKLMKIKFDATVVTGVETSKTQILF